MQFIQLKDIHYCYPDQYKSILSGIDLVIAEQEKIALIGKNGCGKTTLIRIILGELSPSRGQISYPVIQPIVSYLPQDTRISSNLSVEDFLLGVSEQNYQIIAQIRSLEAQTTLSEAQGVQLASLWHEYHSLNLANWEEEVQTMIMDMDLSSLRDRVCDSLSGGEYTRLQLSSLLLEKPDILILDEPTNHLDLVQIKWLEEWLNSYQGAVLYVSHDKSFIDNTASKIAELTNGKLEIRMGNYTSYTRDKHQLKMHQLVQYKQRKQQIQSLREAAQKRRAWASSFQPETRSEGRGAVYESVYNAARTQMQQARNIEKRIIMLNERFPVERPSFEKDYKLRFGPVEQSHGELINISGLSFSYGKSLILSDFYLNLGASERIWLSGANGSGKTTLLRLVAGELTPNEGHISFANRLRIGYYRQDFSGLNPQQMVRSCLLESGKEEGYIRTLMGCVGLKDALINEQVSQLSWGEKAKLQLLNLLLGDYNVLLLDEPTNHLDLKSREMLGKALSNYKGAMIFVSHDRAFIDKVATREVELSCGSLDLGEQRRE
ncbi:MAG TPA: ABC-F family ATP-binding cassette domain-containing protein [Candidatus Cloacimonadota bacterium]|nr:ABC-F family ATP-binding cassette domain-containing protein [Candidatus Cloacimonadota bacterium]